MLHARTGGEGAPALHPRDAEHRLRIQLRMRGPRRRLEARPGPQGAGRPLAHVAPAKAAARARGLDFVPLLQERYYLVCLKDTLEQPAMLALRRVLGTVEWQQALAALPGYAPWKSGEVLSLKAQLPWWDLPPKRKARG
jgi:hypothetical protein